MKGRRNQMLARREARNKNDRLKITAEAHALTAAEWESFNALVAPAMQLAQAAQQAMNTTMQAAAAQLMKERGLSPGEWALDVGKREWVRHDSA